MVLPAAWNSISHAAATALQLVGLQRVERRGAREELGDVVHGGIFLPRGLAQRLDSEVCDC